jgi:hypothetical protein
MNVTTKNGHTKEWAKLIIQYLSHPALGKTSGRHLIASCTSNERRNTCCCASAGVNGIMGVVGGTVAWMEDMAAETDEKK